MIRIDNFVAVVFLAVFFQVTAIALFDDDSSDPISQLIGDNEIDGAIAEEPAPTLSAPSYNVTATVATYPSTTPEQIVQTPLAPPINFTLEPTIQRVSKAVPKSARSNIEYMAAVPKAEKGQKGERGLPGPKGAPGIGSDGDAGPLGQKGQKGDKGDRGWPGADGPPGPPGMPGPTGRKGEMGSPGQDGEKGSQGYKGDSGVSGRDGADGRPGEKGDRGLPGRPGDTGMPGAPGLDGPVGDTGYLGQTGPQGSVGRPGNVGDPGNPGPKGDKGEPGLPGDRGQPGKDGAPGLSGMSGDRGERGDKGDKGEPGLRPNTIAFSVQLSRSLTQIDYTVYDGDHVVPFDQEVTSLGGAINMSMPGIFMAPLHGVYSFFVSLVGERSSQAEVVKRPANSPMSYTIQRFTTNTLLAIELNKCDSVYVKLNIPADDDNIGNDEAIWSEGTIFSGYLIASLE